MPEYGKVTEKTIENLTSIVGSENVSSRPEVKYCYSRDSTIFTHSPDVVIRPDSTDQVAAILRLANQDNIPVTPRGGGTSASGGPLPVIGGILLDMSAMNKIISLDLDNQMVFVEPGIICDALNAVLMKDGFFFPPDPASSSACTIGGMVNTNAAGNRTVKYGSTKDYVLWIEAVTPPGKVIQTGSRTLKSVSGYDLTRLIVGSEGSLVVVTKIGLKIVPLPQHYATAIFVYDAVDALARAAMKVRRAGVVPEMLEFMDKQTTQASFQYAGLKELPVGNFMLLDCGGEKEAIALTLEKCISICKQENPLYVEKTFDRAYRDKLTAARKAALPALARLRPTTVLEDCTVPPSRLPEAATMIEKIPEKLSIEGLDLGNFGHIGDGNMHPTFILDERDKDQVAGFLRGLDILYKEIILPLDGSVTGEHGIGLIRAPYIESEHGSTIQIMRDLKKLFDPKLILNPGKGKGGPYPLKRE